MLSNLLRNIYENPDNCESFQILERCLQKHKNTFIDAKRPPYTLTEECIDTMNSLFNGNMTSCVQEETARTYSIETSELSKIVLSGLHFGIKEGEKWILESKINTPQLIENNLALKTFEIENAIVMCEQSGSNYAHFQLFVLAPLMKLIRNSHYPDNYTILIDDNLSGYRQELVELLPELSKYSFIGLRNRGCIAKNHIRLSKPPAKLIESKYMVNTLLEVWENQKIYSTGNDLPKRFYIERKTSGNGSINRKVQNTKDRDTFLSTHNIALLYMEELSVQDEILLFREAEIVIGVEGAAFINAIHMRSGSKIIELHHKNRHDELWSEICRKKAIKHLRISCPTPFDYEHEKALENNGVRDFMMPLVCDFNALAEILYS